MLQFKEKVINGMIKKFSYKKKEAEDLWKQMELFTLYAFNRSHACSYALMGYYCQWLKTFYPLEFWIANLEFADDEERMNCLNRIISDYKDIKIIYPNINISEDKFVLKDNSIVWSLSHIKGVGDKSPVLILKERDKNGRYKSLQDFYKRNIKSVVNKRVVQSLIFAGAFDELYDIEEPIDRRKILQEYYEIKKEKNKDLKEDSFYEFEYRRLLHLNNLDWDSILARNNEIQNEYESLKTFNNLPDNSVVIVGGTVIKLKNHIPKNKKKEEDSMGMLTIQQNGIELDVILWPSFWVTVKEKVKIGENYFIKGVKKFDNFRKKNVLYSNSDSEIVTIK